MRFALGTAQFGLPYGIANQAGQVSREDANAILALAKHSGIDTLDTAIAYGESEACLGEVGTAGFKIITKLPAIPDQIVDVGQWVDAQIHASLQRLRVPTIYGLLLHRSQQLSGPEGKTLVGALQKLKAEGVVQKVGVSIYSPAELDAVIRACEIDLVQAPFNLIDRRLNTTGWLQKLYDLGVEVHARSVFLQGLLLMPRAVVPAKFQAWDKLWTQWHAWLSSQQCSAAHACIGFLQAFPQIERIVVGVESEQQLRQLVTAASNPFDAELPCISCTDENLINPSRWELL